MKRIFFGIILVLLITGCGKQEYIKCTIDINNIEENYVLNGTYKVYYDNKYVTKIEKKETYSSSKEEILDYFEEKENLEYKRLSDFYGGYEYNIKRDTEAVKINSNINMKLIDAKKMVKNNDLDKDYVINNKLTITGAKYLYLSKGAVCED